MKSLRFLSVIATGLALSIIPARADFIAETTLNGSGTGSPGTGFATVTYNSAAADLTYSVTFSNLEVPATLAHIHMGLPGQNGPIMFPFTNPGPPAATSGSFSGVLTAADLNPALQISFATAISDIQHGDTYINIHTSKFPGGEIRGQLAETPEPATPALLGIALISGGLWFRRRWMLRSSSR